MKLATPDRFDRAKLERMAADVEARRAAHGGLYDSWSAANTEAGFLAGEARRVSPVAFDDLEGLINRLEAEIAQRIAHPAKGDDDRLLTLRGAVRVATTALAAKRKAEALRTAMQRAQEELGPRVAVMTACERWAGLASHIALTSRSA